MKYTLIQSMESHLTARIMLEKARVAFKLNTAQSSGYNYNIVIFNVPVLLHLFFSILFHLTSNKHDAQECRLHCPMPEQERKIINYMTWFGYPNPNVHRVPFQTHWKENSICTIPYRNLPLSDPPRNCCDPPWGVWIFSGTTHLVILAICMHDLSNYVTAERRAQNS